MVMPDRSSFDATCVVSLENTWLKTAEHKRLMLKKIVFMIDEFLFDLI
jgi:hypothetical protein